MNLGDCNLKSVNSSRPQLSHALSEQSITASDDYYSFSEHASEGSSIGSLVTVLRYETPPSQSRSPASISDKVQLEALVSLKVQDVPSTEIIEAPKVVELEEDGPDERKLDESANAIVEATTDNDLSAPTPGLDDTPYIRFAIDQLTRDEELTGRRRSGSGNSEASYPVERIVPDEGLGYYKREGTSPSRRKQSLDRPVERRELPDSENVFIPVDTPEDDIRYSQLRFLPTVLRPTSMTAVLVCCLFMVGVMIFCNIWSAQHNGLLDYDGVGSSRYFLFQYLPQLLASIIVVWRLVLEAAIFRTLPFTALASERTSERFGVLHHMSLFPSRFILPNFALFQQRQPLLGVCFLIFWVSTFTIPLQASAFQTRLVDRNGDAIWRWTTVQPVSWILVALYVLLASAMLTTLIYFNTRRTGLMWDATSLADLIAMIQRSNLLNDFDGTETRMQLRPEQSPPEPRLGYWRLSNNPYDIFYAVGVENESMPRYSTPRKGLMEKVPELRYQDPAGFDVEGQRPLKSASLGSSSQAGIHSPAVRYRWTPWFLQDTFVVAWIVTAFVLLIAFIVVSFVRQAVRNGFLPLIAPSTNSTGFSPADFLYSFIPSLIGLILFLLWQPFDMYFRALQPFSNLADPRGASAEGSLLLNYTSCLPVAVSINAAIAGHYKVACFSFISLLSITLPILGGGIFTAQFFMSEQEVRVAADMTGFYALLVFVILYVMSFLFIWPTRSRYLPHDIQTLADLISFLYQSPLLDDAAFKEPRSKTDLVTRLLSTQAGEKTHPRYAFGVFKGRDGKEHLGIDRLQRPGSRDMIVTTEMI